MRILWLKTELLHPVDKGGKIRTYHMLKELKRNHHVTYLTLDDGSAASDAEELAAEYCHRLIRVSHRLRPKFSVGFYFDLAANLFSSRPYVMKKYESKEMRHQIEMLTGRGMFDVLVCDFPLVLLQENAIFLIRFSHYHLYSHHTPHIFYFFQMNQF